MSRHCHACNVENAAELMLQCRKDTCNKFYDLKCIGMKQDVYNALTVEEIGLWLCPECICANPRRINSDTPVRNANGLNTPRRTPPAQGIVFPVYENVNTKRGSRTGTPVTPMVSAGTYSSSVNDVLLELRELRVELMGRLNTNEKVIMELKEVCFSTMKELNELKITNNKILVENTVKESLVQKQREVITKINLQLEKILNDDHCTQKLVNKTDDITRDRANEVLIVENQVNPNKSRSTIAERSVTQDIIRKTKTTIINTEPEEQKGQVKRDNTPAVSSVPSVISVEKKSIETEHNKWSTVVKKPVNSTRTGKRTTEASGTTASSHSSAGITESRKSGELSTSGNLGGKTNFQQKDVKRGQNANIADIQAMERKKCLHVWRLAAETSVESMTSYVKKICGVDISVKVDKIKHKIERDYASFIVTVPFKEYERLCQPDVWPLNSEFGEWLWFRRPTNRPIEET